MYTRQPQAQTYQNPSVSASNGYTNNFSPYQTSSFSHHNANFYSNDQPTFDRRKHKNDLVQQELADTRKELKELKEHARAQRIPISKASQDMIKFVMEKQGSDCLVVGFGNGAVKNPFLKKNDCCSIM